MFKKKNIQLKKKKFFFLNNKIFNTLLHVIISDIPRFFSKTPSPIDICD